MTQSKMTNMFFDTQYFKNFMPGGLPFDMESVLDAHRKNIEALTEVQQITVESIQTIVQRQSELVTQLVQDNSTLAQQLLVEGTPEEKVARQAELIKTAYERSIAGLREMGELVSKSSNDATEILSERVSESLTEIGTKTAKKAKAETARKAA